MAHDELAELFGRKKGPRRSRSGTIVGVGIGASGSEPPPVLHQPSTGPIANLRPILKKGDGVGAARTRGGHGVSFEGGGTAEARLALRPAEEVVFRVMVVGGDGVGKTAFVRRHAGLPHQPAYTRTLGPALLVVPFATIGGRQVNTHFWDVPHAELKGFKAHMDILTKDVDGVIVLFDARRGGSLVAVDQWRDFLSTKLDLNKVPMFVVGNKAEPFRTRRDSDLDGTDTESDSGQSDGEDNFGDGPFRCGLATDDLASYSGACGYTSWHWASCVAGPSVNDIVSKLVEHMLACRRAGAAVSPIRVAGAGEAGDVARRKAVTPFGGKLPVLVSVADTSVRYPDSYRPHAQFPTPMIEFSDVDPTTTRARPSVIYMRSGFADPTKDVGDITASAPAESIRVDELEKACNLLTQFNDSLLQQVEEQLASAGTDIIGSEQIGSLLKTCADGHKGVADNINRIHDEAAALAAADEDARSASDVLPPESARHWRPRCEALRRRLISSYDSWNRILQTVCLHMPDRRTTT